MEISNIVDYEAIHRLEFVHPVTEEKIGIVWNMRSMESAAAKKVLRKHIDEVYERQQRGKLIKADSAIRRELEKVAACVESWDWGDHTYKGSKPDMSMKTVTDILEDIGWMFAQASEAANKVANFSPASKKNSVGTSS